MLTVILILCLVIFLLSKEYFPPDSVILLAIVALVVLNILTPQEAFSGFGTSLTVTLVCIFILGGILKKNGMVEYFANKLSNLEADTYPKILTIIMLPIGAMSAFMSNTSVVAITFLPFIKWADKYGIKPNKILMPLAFSALLGGTATLIGTSTNIVGNNFLLNNHLHGISMFEFLPIGIALLAASLTFFIFFGERFLKNVDDSTENIKIINEPEKEYFSNFVVGTDSWLVDKRGSNLKDANIKIVKVVRAANTAAEFDNFKVGDILTISGKAQDIKNFYANHSIHGFNLSNRNSKKEIAELLTLPTCEYIGKSLDDENFLKENHIKIIALYRKNYEIVEPIDKIHLNTGDVLICEIDSGDIAKIFYENDFMILNNSNLHEFPNLQKGFLTLAIFLTSIFLSAMSILPVSIALMLAVMIVVILNIIPSNEIFKDIDWRLIILISGMSAFAVAFTKTGLDVYLANLITGNFSFLPPIFVLFIFMSLTVLLTQPMSNAAAVLVVLPIALKAAQNLSLDPRAFSIAIILSASISMITPFEPASLLIMKPGGYKITDFMKVGGILTIISMVIILTFVYLFYI